MTETTILPSIEDSLCLLSPGQEGFNKDLNSLRHASKSKKNLMVGGETWALKAGQKGDESVWAVFMNLLFLMQECM